MGGGLIHNQPINVEGHKGLVVPMELSCDRGQGQIIIKLAE